MKFLAILLLISVFLNVIHSFPSSGITSLVNGHVRHKSGKLLITKLYFFKYLKHYNLYSDVLKRTKRITCDILGSIKYYGKGLNNFPCKVLCFFKGYRRGYCDARASCQCINSSEPSY